jgi:hypothetical protein
VTLALTIGIYALIVAGVGAIFYLLLYGASLG